MSTDLGLSLYEVKFKKVTYKQRYTKKVRQRYIRKVYFRKAKAYRKMRIWRTVERPYWKTVTKEKALVRYKTRRFDFWGTKKEIDKVVRKCFEEGWIPKRRFVRGSAKGFLANPEKYGFKVR